MADLKRLAALKAGEWNEFWGQSNPKCPHCGSVYDIAANDHYSLYAEDEDHEVDCPRCDLAFRVVTDVTYSFNTDEQEDEDDV